MCKTNCNPTHKGRKAKDKTGEFKIGHLGPPQTCKPHNGLGKQKSHQKAIDIFPAGTHQAMADVAGVTGLMINPSRHLRPETPADKGTSQQCEDNF